MNWIQQLTILFLLAALVTAPVVLTASAPAMIFPLGVEGPLRIVAASSCCCAPSIAEEACGCCSAGVPDGHASSSGHDDRSSHNCTQAFCAQVLVLSAACLPFGAHDGGDSLTSAFELESARTPSQADLSGLDHPPSSFVS